MHPKMEARNVKGSTNVGLCGVNQELSWCQWSLTLLPLELKKKLSGLQLEIELTNKVLDVQDESGYRPWFQIREQGGQGNCVGGAFARFGWGEGAGWALTSCSKWSHVLKGRKRATRCLRSGVICSVGRRKPQTVMVNGLQIV